MDLLPTFNVFAPTTSLPNLFRGSFPYRDFMVDDVQEQWFEFTLNDPDMVFHLVDACGFAEDLLFGLYDDVPHTDEQIGAINIWLHRRRQLLLTI